MKYNHDHECECGNEHHHNHECNCENEHHHNHECECNCDDDACDCGCEEEEDKEHLHQPSKYDEALSKYNTNLKDEDVAARTAHIIENM